MKHINKVQAVYERDIDLLLLEEMNVSVSFCRWLAERVSMPVTTIDSFGAWHSISDASIGESDLVMIIDSDNKSLALLIENKIDAPATPKQGERYFKRGAIGILEGRWDWFTTCMVAPQLYLDSSVDAKVYNVNISYETVSEWLRENCADKARGIWKSDLIKEAIEQNRRGYVIIPDEEATAFWQEYWKAATRHYPELQMKQPGMKPVNSDWVHFYPDRLPKGCSLVHKLERGHIDLQVAGAAENLDQLREQVSGQNVIVVKAGKSAAIRVTVTDIDKFQPFEHQHEHAMSGMQAASRLLDIGRNLKVDK